MTTGTRFFLYFCFFFCNFCAAVCIKPQEILEHVERSTNKIIKYTGNDSDFPNIDTLNSLKAIKASNGIDKKPQLKTSACKSCEIEVDKIIQARKNKTDKNGISTILRKLCGTYTSYENEACDGYVNLLIDLILYILDNRENITATRFCGIYFQSQGCVDPDEDHWRIPLPTKIATSQTGSEDDILCHKEELKEVPLLKILQLTDVHYNPEYKAGSVSHDCGAPMCCRSGKADDPEKRAGFWGDYHACDMPWHSLETLMSHVSEKHKNVDFVYFTGDIIDHTSWNTSIEKNSESIKMIYKLLASTFKNKTVYPILGNHESHLRDAFSPLNLGITPNLSIQWLFDLAAKEWARWLPEDALKTVRKGGFYTVLVKPGFRIVGLNSNVCVSNNLWLVYDDRDTYNQLRWLVDVLENAEKNNEKVHILSHVPPGDHQCLRQWNHEFTRIIIRFSKTVAAHFNGHTHNDEFRLFFKTNDTKATPVNVAFVAGSFTTFVGNNPDYRLYELNDETKMVENYDQYTFNLTTANENPTQPIKWFKLYSFKEAYEIKNLSLTEFGNLYNKMKDENEGKTLVEQYYRFMTRESDFEPKPCDEKCRDDLVDFIAVVDADDTMDHPTQGDP